MLLTISQPVQAQQSEVIDSGRTVFNRKCAVCHGLEGTGGGPLGAHLKKRPADLSHISRRNGGTFPFWSVYSTIDGRDEVGSHGSREMPVWGTNEPTETTSGRLTMGQILAIAFFLESLQED
ncbi:MAG: cytochrome c [Gammaproteobacteria bacterium]|nr:cytochrome c [Gammaproteobacteria bacterium]